MDIEELTDNRFVKIKSKGGKKKHAVSIDGDIRLDTKAVKPKKPKRKVSQKVLDNLAKGRATRKANLAGKLEKIQTKVVKESRTTDRPIVVKEEESIRQITVQKEEQAPTPGVAKPVINTSSNQVDKRYVIGSDIDMLDAIYENKEFQMSGNNGVVVFNPPSNEFPTSDAL